MSFQSHVTASDGSNVALPIEIGKTTYILGANGVGKSALMHLLFRQNRENSRRVAAHRQNAIGSNSIDQVPSQMAASILNVSVQDAEERGRYSEWNSDFRPAIMVFELINSENLRTREIASLVTNGKMPEAEKKARESSPLQTISKLLEESNIPIQIRVNEQDSLVASKNGGSEYSISALSDGERNAFLIAANVMTAKSGTMILIDEPERHLHRAIMSPFIKGLIAKRSDCAFVISTHDLELPSENAEANCVLVRNCNFSGSSVVNWNFDILVSNADIDEDVRLEILGGRKTILFVEGTIDSLDAVLYNVLFPSISIYPKGSCKDVIANVDAIRGSQSLHWVNAYGIVDKDQHDAASMVNLRKRGIYALSCYSVESIYYCSAMQEIAVGRLCSLTGKQDIPMLAEAKKAALNSISSDIDRLAARLIEKSVRDRLMGAAPNWKTLVGSPIISLNIDVPEILNIEKQKLQDMLTSSNLDSIIDRYPIRETKVIDEIIKKLEFKDRDQYQSIVLGALKEDGEARQKILNSFEGLASILQ